MSYIFFAWMALFAWGLFIIIGKLTTKYAIANPWLFNFSWTFFTLFLTIPIAVYNHVGLPTEWNTIILAALFNALWFIFFALATYKLDVSVLSPLYNFRAIFAVLLGVILLGEKLNSLQILLFILIIIGGIFTSLDEKFNIKSFINSSIAIGISAMFFLALNNIYVNKVFQNNGFWEGTLWMLIFTQIFLLTTLPLFVSDLHKVVIKQIFPLIIMGILAVVGNIWFNIAYKVNVSVTSLIAAIPASMIFAFIFSIIKPELLEKHTLKIYLIRFTAAAVMIFAAVKLSV